MENTWQIVIDCARPQAMVRFWAEALRYVPEPAPDGHPTWRAYWQSMGVPDDELPPGTGDEPESLVDPQGGGPRIWFQQVSEAKSIKNRLHLDLLVSGGRGVRFEERRQNITDEAERLVALGAKVRTVHDMPEMGHFAICMFDIEGNEFDIV
ncbi:VOC family protein [Glutamicibacter sp. AGC13]